MCKQWMVMSGQGSEQNVSFIRSSLQQKRNGKINKTGSHQCTRAFCSIFAGIHSTLTPRCIDALFGVRIPFQSLVQSPEGTPGIDRIVGK